MTTAIVLLTAALNAPPTPLAPEHHVIVCFREHEDSLLGVYQARYLASRMFAEIGVKLHWSFHNKTCPAGAITIHLTGRIARGLPPGVLGYAELHARDEIRVLYDEIVNKMGYAKCSAVLAHVMVHEITHIIQDVNRHSTTGVMKAYWEPLDFSSMPYVPMKFAKEDVDLIYRNLEARITPAAWSATGRAAITPPPRLSRYPPH
jgi:hypothetical protein